MMKQQFPFGQPLLQVEQTDTKPKMMFVLGVYAGAVHAKWIGEDERVKVQALAVASEPYIFWRGEGAEEIIDKIRVPKGCGYLEPATNRHNGHTGRVLDEFYFTPLGLKRESDAWLCDLVPYYCDKASQKSALKRTYLPLVQQFKLPVPTIIDVPKKFTDEERREQILQELEQSQAKYILTLGDQPIEWFLSFFTDGQYTKLSDFGKTADTYGRLHTMSINGKEYQILPLTHPRQAVELGVANKEWREIHDQWVQQNPAGLIQR